jgi:hypothetical protein
VYDPVDHMFHSAEFGCPTCQDIYAGVLMRHGDRLFGTLVRIMSAG